MAHFIPTERDREVLNWMLQQIRNMPVNTPPPSVLDPSLRVHPGTGAYIARVHSRIAGLGHLGSGSDEVPVPGSALCEIYRIVENQDGTVELRKYEALKKRVYNISHADLTSEYVLVTQLADGRWVSTPQNDRWEFGKMTTNASVGVQTAETTYADVTDGPVGGNSPTGENVEVNYVQGYDLVIGDIVTLSWKNESVYAIPWDCEAGTGS